MVLGDVLGRREYIEQEGVRQHREGFEQPEKDLIPVGR